MVSLGHTELKHCMQETINMSSKQNEQKNLNVIHDIAYKTGGME